MARCHKSILCAFSKQKGWCISCLFSIIPLFPFLEQGTNLQRHFSCRRPSLLPHFLESFSQAAVTKIAIKTRGDTPQGFMRLQPPVDFLKILRAYKISEPASGNSLPPGENEWDQSGKLHKIEFYCYLPHC